MQQKTGATDRSAEQVVLKDGRMLGYQEFGVDSGDVAGDLNVRVIAVDRPGHGHSDFQPGRTILDWPDDVTQLADLLGLDHFAVLGVSGGGPFAAACAFKIPERLTSTAIVSGMGPPDAPGAKDGTSWTYPGKGSLMRRLILMLTAMGVRKDPDRFGSSMEELLEGPDKAMAMERPEVVKATVDTIGEALRSGIAGVHHEAGLYTRNWGFRLEDIKAEVHLWHGEQDDNVRVSVGRHVAAAIPNCRATFLENEGHLTLIDKSLRDVLDVLA